MWPLNTHIKINIIKRVDHTKSLGLTIDAQLSWGKHAEEIKNKKNNSLY